LPLESIHPQARRAAEAARCANAQGKFWEYYDVLFTESPKLGSEDLKRYAVQIGIDPKKFDDCLSACMYKEVAQNDADEAACLGINGTPAFFLNGQPLKGSTSVEMFARVIDE